MHDMLVGRSDRFAAPPDNTGRQGSGFKGRSLLSRNIPVRLKNPHVVIMSVHDTMLIADFLVVLESG